MSLRVPLMGPGFGLRLGAILVLCLTATDTLGQTAISVFRPGIIDSVFRNEIPPADGRSALSYPLGRMGGLATAPNGDVIVAVQDYHRVYRITPSGRIFLVAGTSLGYGGDGGPASSAKLYEPMDVAVDRSGNVYIADFGNYRIRRVTPQGAISTFGSFVVGPSALALDPSGNIYVYAKWAKNVLKVAPDGSPAPFAGNGANGFSGDGGPAVLAALGDVGGIAADAAGNVFLSDSTTNRIRKVTAGVITTVAGTGVLGWSADNVPAAEARLAVPMGLSVDDSGNVLVADNYNHVIRSFKPGGTMTTVAGLYLSTSIFSGAFTGDNGPALKARMSRPYDSAVDANGNLYVVDGGRIRKVDSTTGIITTFAGNGRVGGPDASRNRNIAIDPSGNVYVSGQDIQFVYRVRLDGVLEVVAGGGGANFSGDGGLATKASLFSPQGLAADSAGNVYIADSGNHRIRRVSPDGLIVTVAGNGINASAGDGGQAYLASLSSPNSVAVTPTGFMYIGETGRVRRVGPDGIIQTIAGTGVPGFNGDGPALQSAISRVPGFVVDRSGNVIFSDAGNQRIRRLTPDGRIETIAGTGVLGFNGDGPALSSDLNTPFGLALDEDENLYFSDENNHRIRKLTADGKVTTIAGGTFGFAGDGGPAELARFYSPAGLAWHPAGALYIADISNGAIRRISFRPSARFSISGLEAVSRQSSVTGQSASNGYARLDVIAGDGLPDAVAVIGSRENGALVSEWGVAASAPLLSGRIYAEVSGSVNTGIAMVNPGDTAAEVRFFFSHAAGDTGAGNLIIPPRTQTISLFTESPFNLSQFQGSFTFTSSVPIAVSAVRRFLNERSEFLHTALPVVDLQIFAVTAPGVIPQYVSGAGWSSHVLLTNPSDENLAGVLRLHSPTGAAGGEMVYSIPPKASQDLLLEDNGQIRLGSIRVTPLNGVTPAAVVLLSYSTDGVTRTLTTSSAVAAAEAFRVYAERSVDFPNSAPGSAETSVAIANTTDKQVGVAATVGPLAAFPAPNEVVNLTIPAHGQLAISLKDLLPKASMNSGVQSVLRLHASGPVSVSAFMTRYNERGEFLLSAMPAVDEQSPKSMEPHYFPLFADSESFSTRVILFSGRRGGISEGELNFFTPSGQPVSVLR